MTKASYSSLYQAGREAFECGLYRQSIEYLEAAREMIELSSGQGGEVGIWLVTAYQAANRLSEALSLVRQLTHHPNLEIRKQSKQILYILEAPKLQRPPEWMTEIPDLTTFDETKSSLFNAASHSRKPVTNKKTPIKEIPSNVVVQDNSFIWFALALSLLSLGALVLISF